MNHRMLMAAALALMVLWLLTERQAGAGTTDPCKGFYYTDDGVVVIPICK